MTVEVGDQTLTAKTSIPKSLDIASSETMGNIVTWGSIIVFLVWVNAFFKNMQDKRIDKLAFAFLFILTCCVFFTAYLGGQLVWV